jgi:hypothetical protein
MVSKTRFIFLSTIDPRALRTNCGITGVDRQVVVGQVLSYSASATSSLQNTLGAEARVVWY